MSRNRAGLPILILVLLPVLFLTGVQVQASRTLNVSLTRFEAIPLDNAARLEWDTQTELGTAGYMVKRGQNGSFDYLSDTAGKLFVNSEGGPTQGFDYEITDETAVNGEFYTYQLIEILIDASEVVVADTSVTIGIIPTNTPIIVSTSGNSGSNSNTTRATETATSFATIVPTQAQPAKKTPAPLATPLPTQLTETSPVVDEVNAAIGLEAQSITEQPLNQEKPQSGQAEDTGVAVVFAQEDPPGYPGSDPAEVEMGESLDAAAVDAGNNLENAAGSVEEPVFPEIIGDNPYPAGNLPSDTDSDLPIAGADNSDRLEGELYLWVGFLAAIMIFSAAVLGAILLYTRQRNRE